MAECFQIKKGTVIFFCLLNIAIYIFVAGLAEIVIANEYNVNDNRTQHKATILVIVTVIIAVLFQLVGILGAFSENVCLLLTYLIITSLLSFSVILKGFIDFLNLKFYWSVSMWFAFNALLVVALLRSLQRIRGTLLANQTESVNSRRDSYTEIA